MPTKYYKMLWMELSRVSRIASGDTLVPRVDDPTIVSAVSIIPISRDSSSTNHECQHWNGNVVWFGLRASICRWVLPSANGTIARRAS
jgi:hypothetical protein